MESLVVGDSTVPAIRLTWFVCKTLASIIFGDQTTLGETWSLSARGVHLSTTSLSPLTFEAPPVLPLWVFQVSGQLALFKRPHYLDNWSAKQHTKFRTLHMAKEKWYSQPHRIRKELFTLLTMANILMTTKVASEALVDIINYAGEPIFVHCKSHNSDLGRVMIDPNDDFLFKFNSNIFGTTLFWCTFELESEKQDFPVWKGTNYSDRPPCSVQQICLYKVALDGIYWATSTNSKGPSFWTFYKKWSNWMMEHLPFYQTWMFEVHSVQKVFL